jgi:hypothetical protein
MDLYIHSPIRLHDVVLKWLSTGTNLPYTLYCKFVHLVARNGPDQLLESINGPYIAYTCTQSIMEIDTCSHVF